MALEYDLTPQLINEILHETRWPPFYNDLVAKHGRELIDQMLEEDTARAREKIIAMIPQPAPQERLQNALKRPWRGLKWRASTMTAKTLFRAAYRLGRLLQWARNYTPLTRASRRR